MAKLGLADLMKSGPRSPAELARSVGADPQTLRRVLRALAGVGVFADRKDGRFALTPLGSTLRSDRPDSMRAFAIMMVDDYNWQAWADLLQSVKTGQTAFDRVHGLKIFDYLGQHPDKARVFGEAMTSISGAENPAVAAAYDFSRVVTLVDVGGSHGHLLAAILKANPKLKGVLVKILENCRRAMAPKGRVLVVDTVIPPGNDPHWGKLLDINMLVGPGGRERTRSEFVELFARAGLKLRRIIPTASPLSILEGVPA